MTQGSGPYSQVSLLVREEAPSGSPPSFPCHPPLMGLQRGGGETAGCPRPAGAAVICCCLVFAGSWEGTGIRIPAVFTYSAGGSRPSQQHSSESPGHSFCLPALHLNRNSPFEGLLTGPGFRRVTLWDEATAWPRPQRSTSDPQPHLGGSPKSQGPAIHRKPRQQLQVGGRKGGAPGWPAHPDTPPGGQGPDWSLVQGTLGLTRLSPSPTSALSPEGKSMGQSQLITRAKLIRMLN